MKDCSSKTILIIAKYPPIQGGVSALVYNTARNLAKRGNKVHIVTNANEVESCYKEIILDSDLKLLKLKCKNGGFVKLHNISNISNSSFQHIPMSEAYESRLLGLGIEVISKINKIDLIIGWYFQPYGIVSSILANKFNIQHLLIHAGSDIGRLLHHKNLLYSYKFMVNKASKIIASKNKTAISHYKKLGVNKKQLEFLKGGIKTPDYYNYKKTFQIDKYIIKTIEWIDSLKINSYTKLKILETITNNKINKNKITIGIYGKIGSVKGTLELIKSLEILSIKNIEFNFLQIPLANNDTIEAYLKELIKHPKVLQNTILLPPLAPWEIPGFIRTCDIVCFLENNFDIHHTPKIAMEILSAGSCLFCTNDSIDKSFIKDMMVNEINYVRINTQNFINDLSEKLIYYSVNHSKRKEIAKLGKYTINKIEESFSTDNALADSILKIIE